MTSTWSGTSVASADGAHAVDVEAVAAAELQLQALEAPARVRLRRLRPHLVGRREPDRPRGRRPEPLEPEHPPDRLAEELAAEVVQRRVDRRPRGELVVGQALHHVVQGERVVAEVARDALDERERRLGRLVVALDRRRLAEPGDALVPDLDLDDLGGVLRPARDRERLGELEGDDPGGQLHARTSLEGLTPQVSDTGPSPAATLAFPAPVAQGIERAPPEREVAGSIPARRIRTRMNEPPWLRHAGQMCQ